ncbi:MAG: immunoglobulin domain-containing protein [Pyrinomonadaceae bacterium]|nr:immunoglobulin domain-containing protein [Phycisphaerales bacterium]
MKRVLNQTLVALVSGSTLASSVFAQCADWVEQPPLRLTGVVRATTTWDSDGAGPLPAWLVVAGEFERAGGVPVLNVAAWDGSTWRALGDGITQMHNLGVRALAVYNGQLIAGGGFAFAGEEPAFNIARFNGSEWRPMGDIFGDSGTTEVQSLVVYNNELIAAGHFSEAGGVATRNIAAWNGISWHSLDSGINSPAPSETHVSAMAAYKGELYAGGHFSVAGSFACNNIARWNGSTWQPVSGGIGQGHSTDRVLALAVHNNELMVGGYFAGPGGAGSCQNVAGWNGSTWRGLGIGTCSVNDTVHAMASFGGSLYASGIFQLADGQPVQHIARWDGTGWHAVAEGTDAWTGTLGTFNNQLVAGGHFFRAGSLDVEGLARWNGNAWLPMTGVTKEPVGRVDAMVPWAGRMVIGGSHGVIAPRGAGSGLVSLLSVWDGVNVSGIGHPNSTVRSMITKRGVGHSSDLIIGGDFTDIDGFPVSRIARLNDTLAGGWQPFGQGFNGSVNAIEVHNGSVYAAGSFTQSGSTNLNFVARWNGAAWEPLGNGVFGTVHALKSYNGKLYVGGSFTTASGVFAPGVAVWDGFAWSALDDSAFVGTVYALAVHRGVLVIGGEFPGFGNSPNLAWFVDLFFGRFGTGTNGPVRSLTTSNDTLVVGGDFTVAGGQSSAHLARWHGAIYPPGPAGWSAMPGATDGPVHALASYSNDLHVGGEFMDVRGESLYAPLWARFSETGVPWIADQPDAASGMCGSDIGFAVTAASGYEGLQFQWLRNGTPIVNGATGTGSTIVITGASVRIEHVGTADAGLYDCVVSNVCGDSTSLAAALTVNGCPACRADFNSDGVVNSQDFFDFLAAFFAAAPAADFNADGNVNSQDFFDFVTSFFTGC